jgi:hypothetical protein
MNQSSVNDNNALLAYINNLNEKAAKADLRNYPFVPPKGTVLTVACDKDHHASIGVANGKGGIVHHQLPVGVYFTCRRIDDPKPCNKWRFTKWLEKKVGITN